VLLSAETASVTFEAFNASRSDAAALGMTNNAGKTAKRDHRFRIFKA
jgi:hypothetical protein